MSIKASEVDGWLRQIAGKRDHRKLMRENELVLRPGPNFHSLMGHPAADPPTPSGPAEQDPTGEGGRAAEARSRDL